MSGTTAGWYPDPYDSTQMRWFDGSAWTENVQPLVNPVGIAADHPSANAGVSTQGTGQSGWQNVQQDGVYNPRKIGDTGETVQTARREVNAAPKAPTDRKILVFGGVAVAAIALAAIFGVTAINKSGSSAVVADPGASTAASASPSASAYTTPDSAEAIASSLLKAPYLDGVLGIAPDSFVDGQKGNREIEGGYAADAAYKNQKATGTQDPTEVQLSVSWYGDDKEATTAFRNQASQEDAVFIEKFKSQFTTKSPYLDGQMMVRTVRDEGPYLVTALCVGPTTQEALLQSCAQSSGNAQARQTATQFNLNGGAAAVAPAVPTESAAPVDSAAASPAAS